MPSIGTGRLLVLSASILGVSITPLCAQRSRAMSLECVAAGANTPENRKKAEEWVQEKLKAFLPAPDGSLRMRALEEAEQVKLAIYGISTTCEQYRAGKMDKGDADLTLSGFEETIDNFYHDTGVEAIALASRAQVSELPKIRTLLTAIGSAGRQAALLGEDKLADEARKKMLDVLTTFSRTFVDQSCWDQSFDDDLPFAFQQQNDILGTDIDVRPCAQRRFKAQAEIYTFESCSIRGIGAWRVLWNMAAPGTTGGRGEGEMKLDGNRAKGDYKVDWGANGVEYRASGKMALDREDHGGGQKPTYLLSGDMEIKLVKGKEKIAMLEKLMGQKTKPTKGEFDKVPTQVSEKPCKSLDE
jgi:hypothetical protein